MIKEGWRLPEPPDGFDKPIAVYHQGGDVELDWTREPERDFASSYDPVNIKWPFLEGVEHIKDGKPDVELWKTVGILPIW